MFSGNLQAWVTAIGVVAIIVLTVALIRTFVIRRFSAKAERTKTIFDDAVLNALQATKIWLVGMFALSLGTQYLTVSPKVVTLLRSATTIAIFLQAGMWGAAALKVWLHRTRTRMLEKDAGTATSLTILGLAMN